MTWPLRAIRVVESIQLICYFIQVFITLGKCIIFLICVYRMPQYLGAFCDFKACRYQYVGIVGDPECMVICTAAAQLIICETVQGRVVGFGVYSY